jgi:hypothetical protein
MKTRTVILASQDLLEPPAGHFQLSQTSTATKPGDPWDFDPESFTFRATTVTVVLKEILEQRDHIYGGIND